MSRFDRVRRREGLAGFVAVCLAGIPACATDPLPSWNDTAPKQAIVGFVKAVSDPESPSFVPPAERVATFDNDGTLWSEQPVYFQLLFAIDRVKALAARHPEWKETQPFRVALEGDLTALAVLGKKGLLQLILATHAHTTTEEFDAIVTEWLAAASHPRFKRPFTDLVFQPMLELLAYLRANGFQTFIVSGGGLEFLRTFSERVYGVPPEQVIGSSIETRFEQRDGAPVLVRLPEIHFIDDGPGKPVGIHRHIGRRPIAAFGNFDGDLQMLQWTAAGDGRRFALLVHHTDPQREWAYDRDSKIGHFDAAWDEALEQGWTVVDMKRDWKVVYPFELQSR